MPLNLKFLFGCTGDNYVLTYDAAIEKLFKVSSEGTLRGNFSTLNKFRFIPR